MNFVRRVCRWAPGALITRPFRHFVARAAVVPAAPSSPAADEETFWSVAARRPLPVPNYTVCSMSHCSHIMLTLQVDTVTSSS